jgi:hypothetical protein
MKFAGWTKLTDQPDIKACINVIRCPLCQVHFPPRIYRPDTIKARMDDTYAVTGCNCGSATSWPASTLRELLKGVVRL